MVIKRFEDIDSWKEGRILAAKIYAMSRKGQFKSGFGLRDQICRAAVSITSNIAEGFESQSNFEFIKFLTYSRRSAAEVKSQLYIALDNGYTSKQEFNELYDEASQVSKLLTGFINYLKNNKSRKS